MENDIALSYKSICLYKDDIECLKDYRYLNDMNISFYYEYLSNTLSLPNEIVLMDPSAVSSIIHFDDDLSELKSYFMDLTNKRYIFLPVNDNTDKSKAGGGSHWALLVYQAEFNTFYYFDSMQRYIDNTDVLIDRIALMIGKSDFEVHVPSIKKYQENAYDCGVFVLMFTEAILKFIEGKLGRISIKTSFDLEVFKNVSQKGTLAFRENILKIIENLKIKK
jgi:sentrin-specific protease 8